MQPATSYEIHTYTNGAWKIQAFFDDKELALLDARRMSESRRYVGIRVIEETWNPSTDQAQSRIIFRDSEVQRQNETATGDRAQVRKEAEQQREKRNAARTRKTPAKKKAAAKDWRHSYIMLALKGFGIVLLGMVLIWGLQALSG
jgi:hypothetical protein